jgi:hypothetical protein
VAVGTPRSVIVTVVLAVLVAAGAVGGAGVLRWRAAESTSTPTTSQKPAPTGVVGVSGCLVEPCKVLATTTVGGTTVELVADDGARSGRLRVGGPTSGSVIETTLTDLSVLLTADSLQCIAGGPAACLIKGGYEGGTAGQIIVGRSDKWSALEKPYISDAGYLALANINGDVAPEVLAAQHAGCARSDGACPVFMQVFTIAGTVVGCTKEFPRLDKLPGYPGVKLTEAALTPCR